MSVTAPPRTALVAHGKNWELPIPTNSELIRPSLDTRLTAEAAGILFTRGWGDITFDRIILSTGHTAGPDYPSEAGAMKGVIRQHFDTTQIPDDAFIMEELSWDTPTNLSFTYERCREHGIGRIVLLTVGYHRPRTRKLARSAPSDIQVIGCARSEKVVQEARGESGLFYPRSIVRESIEQRSVRPVARAVSSRVLEVGAWTLLSVDPSGEGISRKFTTRMRHQVNA